MIRNWLENILAHRFIKIWDVLNPLTVRVKSLEKNLDDTQAAAFRQQEEMIRLLKNSNQDIYNKISLLQNQINALKKPTTIADIRKRNFPKRGTDGKEKKPS